MPQVAYVADSKSLLVQLHRSAAFCTPLQESYSSTGLQQGIRASTRTEPHRLRDCESTGAATASKLCWGSAEVVLVLGSSGRCRVGKAQGNGNQVVSAGAYATAADFQQIFSEDINSLYFLSLLLTGNQQKAEECFVAGIGESTKRNHVFREWARSWARRTIIQSAIRLVGPRERSSAAIRNTDVERAMDKVPLVLHAEVRAILELAPFDRFVFVISVLERYSDHDCSILLNCARRDIAPARTRAMQQLVTSLGLRHRSPADARSENSATPEDAERVIELVLARHFAAPAWNMSLSR